jgi:competence protein ComEA
MLRKFFAALSALLAATAFAAVDANKATQAELEAVPGIGPATSAMILDERKKSEFKDWTDFVSRVKGVGDRSATKFSEGGLTVAGKPYPGAPGSKAAPASTSAKASGPSRAVGSSKSGPSTAASAARK